MATRRQECSICLETFTNPKLLPCHHTFCSSCLDGVIKASAFEGHFKCPLCQRKVKIPEKGVSGFQTNFYIEPDIEVPKQGNRFTCDICGPKTIAVSICLECAENLCQYCRDCHEKMKATKTHKIRNLDDKNMKGKIRQRSYCGEHEEEEIKVICLQCNVPICIVCKTIDHEGHTSKALNKAASELKASLEAKLTQCNSKLERLRISYLKGEEYMKEMDKKEHNEKKAVEEKCMHLISVIKEDEENMKTKIQSAYNEMRKENSDLMLALQNDMEASKSTVVAMQEVIGELSDLEIIDKSQDLEAKIADFIGTHEADMVKEKYESNVFTPNVEKCTTFARMIGSIEDPSQRNGMADLARERNAYNSRKQYPLFRTQEINKSTEDRQYYPLSQTQEVLYDRSTVDWYNTTDDWSAENNNWSAELQNRFSYFLSLKYSEGFEIAGQEEKQAKRHLKGRRDTSFEDGVLQGESILYNLTALEMQKIQIREEKFD